MIDKIPEELAVMVMNESLPEPGIYFAGFNYEYVERAGSTTSIAPTKLVLTKWGDTARNIQSGHSAVDNLESTCQTLREIARREFSSADKQHKSLIPYRTGPKTMSTNSDLLCLVPISPPLNVLGHCIPVEEMKDVRQIGIRVDAGMWHELLGFMFHGGTKLKDWEELHQQLDGHLDVRLLASLIACFPGRKSLYFVLTDVTWEDWERYYSGFPVAFSDASAPYVEVTERPIHFTTFEHLWNGEGIRSSNYPFPELHPHHPLISRLDPSRGARVDKFMHPKQRVSLLLRLLRTAECQFNSAKLARIRVLARKPHPPTIKAAVVGDGETSAAIEAVRPEDKWIREALRTVYADSDLAYDTSDRYPWDDVDGEKDGGCSEGRDAEGQV